MPIDPLAEVVTFLQPAARFSKLVECAGSWRICPPGTGEPFYCAVLEGVCTATVDGQAMTLQAGDFVLVPAIRELVNESTPPPREGVKTEPVEVNPGRFRVGEIGTAR